MHFCAFLLVAASGQIDDSLPVCGVRAALQSKGICSCYAGKRCLTRKGLGEVSVFSRPTLLPRSASAPMLRQMCWSYAWLGR